MEEEEEQQEQAVAAMGLLGAGRRATARLLRGGLRSIRIRTHPPVADERFCSTAVGAGGAAPWPKELSFSFSGAGFLAPFHLGAVKLLLDKGIVNERTKLAGASAGSLVAASTVLGLSPEEQLGAYMRMTHACRASGYIGRVYPVLAQSLRERFPDNAHEICNGRLTVALMRLWPNPRLSPVLIDRFSSKDDLVDALVTSSHVPLYLDAAQPLWRRFRGGLYADGGLIDLVPPVPDAIKICVFPPSFLFRSDLHVHPHLLNNSNADSASATSKARAASKGKGPAEDFPFSIAQLLRWAFVAPADDADIERLYMLGQQAALEWLVTGGIQEAREIHVVESQALEDDKGRRVVPSNAAALAAASGPGTGGPVKEREEDRPSGLGGGRDQWKGG